MTESQKLGTFLHVKHLITRKMTMTTFVVSLEPKIAMANDITDNQNSLSCWKFDVTKTMAVVLSVVRTNDLFAANRRLFLITYGVWCEHILTCVDSMPLVFFIGTLKTRCLSVGQADYWNVNGNLGIPQLLARPLNLTAVSDLSSGV